MLKVLILYVLEKMFRLIGKDNMKFKIKRYRMYGANIGDNVRAFSPVSSAESYLITVGNNVTIAGGVKFLTHDNAVSKIPEGGGTDLVGRITIGDNCFIGHSTVILPGVEIADCCIIGAGSLVCKSCKDTGVVLAGNPAQRICTVEEYFQKNKKFIFDFKNKDKRKLIFENEEKLLEK